MEISFLNFYNFTLFFPTFLSGPFDRYLRFYDELLISKKIENEDLYYAVKRIIIGLFKKIIIADNLLSFGIDNFSIVDLKTTSTIVLILSNYIYMFTLYFDFSGYSDIAIGVSKLFGITTPENFKSPFLARNIQVFWNSWHISFFKWLSDYIYIPVQRLLINIRIKNFTLIACVSFMFTFLCAGIWHSDKLFFLQYGLFHGLGFAIFVIYQKNLSRILTRKQMKLYKSNNIIRIFATILTIHYFWLSLFLFVNKFDAVIIILERL